MSKKSRLFLLGTLVLVAVIAATSWFGMQQARDRKLLEDAVNAAKRAADAGPPGKPLCERAVAVLEPRLTKESLGDDQTVAAYRALGECQMLLERFDAAASTFETVVTLEPQQSRAHADVARALSKLGRHSEAARSASLSVQLAPHVWQAHRALALVLSAAGRTDEAIAAFQKAKSLAPESEHAGADRAIARLRSTAPGSSKEAAK